MTAFNAPNDLGETDVAESEGAGLLRVRQENADAKMVRAFLKSVHLLLPGSVGHERHAFGLILAEKANFSITRMVRLLGVSRSGWITTLIGAP